MTKLLKKFARSESGATGIEYGIIAAFIALAIIAGITITGDETSQSFTNAADGLRDGRN